VKRRGGGGSRSNAAATKERGESAGLTAKRRRCDKCQPVHERVVVGGHRCKAEWVARTEPAHNKEQLESVREKPAQMGNMGDSMLRRERLELEETL